MYCQSCGTENTDDSTFCKKCGKSFDATSTTQRFDVTLEHISPVNYLLALITPIGWILFISNKNLKPDNAKAMLFASILAPIGMLGFGLLLIIAAFLGDNFMTEGLLLAFGGLILLGITYGVFKYSQ